MIAVLGNRHAIESPDHGKTFVKLPKGKRATHVEVPEEYTLAEAFTAVTSADGIWSRHSENAKAPAWVASDSRGLAALLSEHFGGIEVRDLEEAGCCDDPTPADLESGGKVVARFCAKCLSRLPMLVSLMLAIHLLGLLFARTRPFLLTNAGKDMISTQVAGSASATAVAKWVALTANTTAPAAGDTTLTGEITTGGGGLIRKTGVYAHTNGTSTYTLTTVFTANGSDSLPVTIGKRGVFDAASVGNMVYETLVSPTATLSASGDVLTLTDTVTLS